MKRIIIGNHKNYMLVNELGQYLDFVDNTDTSKVNLILCPSAIYMPYFLKKNYKVGIQNVAIRSELTCTGEITSKQAKSMGINYTIIGHSERRLYAKEAEQDINKKIFDALRYGLRVILCVGETLEEKNTLKTARVLKKQLKEDLKNVEDFASIVIAYEPVWAIGSGQTPTVKEISEAAMYIKDTIDNLYGYANAKVLYGGSVNSKNIDELNGARYIDGFLIGKASTDVEEFKKIIESTSL